MKNGAIAVGIALALAASGYGQAGTNPFIPKPAKSPEQLANMVKNNPTYMDRYVRHFQMEEAAVVAMIRGLRLVRLDKDTTVEMFNVPAKTGVLRSRRMTLKKGTEVWVNANGEMVLKASCGNPLMRTDEAEEPVVRVQVGAPLEAKDLAIPAGASPAGTMVIHPIEPLPPVAPDVAFETPPAITEVVSRGNDSASFAAGFALLPSVLIGLSGGGGNPIPEPSTLLALSTGAAFILARAKRRRSR